MPLCLQCSLSGRVVFVMVGAALAAPQLAEESFVILGAVQSTQSVIVDLAIASLVAFLERAELVLVLAPVLAPGPVPADARLALVQCIAESIRR